MTFKVGDRVVQTELPTDGCESFNTRDEVLVVTVGGGNTFKCSRDGLIRTSSRYKLADSTAKGGGQKLDDGKLPLQLLDPAALEEVAKVLAVGAKKYSPNNWRKGLSYTRVVGATLRHIFAFMRGEDNDPETGLSHIAHAKCELMFLLSYILSKRTDLDDRYNKDAK